MSITSGSVIVENVTECHRPCVEAKMLGGKVSLHPGIGL